jgi:hypothetical protein
MTPKSLKERLEECAATLSEYPAFITDEGELPVRDELRAIAQALQEQADEMRDTSEFGWITEWADRLAPRKL